MRLRIPILLISTQLALATAAGGDTVPEQTRLEDRRLDLDGPANFRDIGGLQTTDGMRVKRNLFFRSDKLEYLSDADLDLLHHIGVKVVCDFRSHQEVSDDPDRLHPSMRVLALPIDQMKVFTSRMPPSEETSMISRTLAGDMDGVDIRAAYHDMYRNIIKEHIAELASFFTHIIEPKNLPTILHCTAGKDRTGVASAILLRILGVPMETVMQDFLLSNRFLEKGANLALFFLPLASFFRADAGHLRPVFFVEKSYLEAAFDEIEAIYGSFDRFVIEGLRLDAEKQAQLRALALE